MTPLLMHNGMARTAERLEIFQRIVSVFARCGDAQSVNVMNVQIVLCTATLAGVVVALQGVHAVAVKAVVVFGLLAVLLNLVGVLGRPFSYASDVRIIAARLALSLRSGGVFKQRSAIFAGQHVSFARSANSVTFGSAIFGAFHAMIFFFTSVTRFLRRACRLVVLLANYAPAISKSDFGLTVCSKGAGLTSLRVRACPCYLRATVRTVNNAIGFHMSRSRMIPDIYSGGAV